MDMGGRGYVSKKVNRITDKQKARAFNYNTNYLDRIEAVAESYVVEKNGIKTIKTRIRYQKKKRK